MSQNSPCLWSQLPQSISAPCDRYKHACCSHDGNVYILGGRDNGTLRDFWRYSVVRNEWTELSSIGETAPEEVEAHSMVAHEGFIYVFGGTLDSAYTSLRCPLWVFDIAKQKWVHCPRKASGPQSPMPTNRKGHSAVVGGSSMLVYGGFVDIKGSSQEFWSLDFDTMVWSLLTGLQQGSLSPGPRHSHSAMVYQSCMYLFGGLKGLREQRDFWKWNPASYTWSSLKTKSGPSKLIGHSAVAYKDSMLLFGGGESLNYPKNCLWRYNFSTHTWWQINTMPGSSSPDKIHHCCIGLGPNYTAETTSICSEANPKLHYEKFRPFKNKCFPAPLTFLGSEGAIELQTFTLDKCHLKNLSHATELDKSDLLEKTVHRDGSCLTFENKAFSKDGSCTEEELLEGEDEDVSQHLPDLLLVLGGRPCLGLNPLSVWQMTLSES
ncbi:ras guanine nucleotide exchange factor F isoform X1 [Phyllopteryx taeniolatus]|uniref:ras guanine nucleotide exchange factor F isoform X1 n=2 Tax=Phyllopteryx taeniolatus TaxID=161469 RepID=UPI002AD4D4D4|nr:ras guanine nucleotide exchange factor F isoform X1 [Phyllopteryx taeniolatus]XP_061648682.1 ras guanine nucleotide exchange factor F isoform X1 [Phyllopteryx taeniolatus]XP_061648683.1 ras guanine nucleotide exchange factor F isoform X1 [Phyllopteryx taeniolatus]